MTAEDIIKDAQRSAAERLETQGTVLSVVSIAIQARLIQAQHSHAELHDTLGEIALELGAAYSLAMNEKFILDGKQEELGTALGAAFKVGFETGLKYKNEMKRK